MAIFDIWKKFGGRFVKQDLTTPQPTNYYGLPTHSWNVPFKMTKEQKNRIRIYRMFYGSLVKRDMLLGQLREIRYKPITQTTIDVIIDDGFYSNANLEVYQMVCKDKAKAKQAEERMKKTMKRFKTQQATLELLPELILFGEYLMPFEYDKEGKKEGITYVGNTARLEDVLPLYDGQDLKCFLKRTWNPKEPVIEEPKDKYVHFCMPGERIPIEVTDDSKGFLEKYNLKETLKMGKSLFIPLIDLIKQLESLEATTLALMLRNIVVPVIAGVTIPSGTPPKELREIKEYYQRIFEDIFRNVGDVANLQSQDIVNLASKMEFVPIYTDGKGSMDVISLHESKDLNPENVNNIKQSISQTAGVPYYYYSSIETKENRLETLKVHSRYSKRLNEFQMAVKLGWQYFHWMDLKHAGIDVDIDDLECLVKEIVNIDTLDNLEYIVGAGVAVRELYDVAQAIAENEELNLGLDPGVLLKIVDTIFDNMPITKGLLVKKPPPPKEDQAKEDDEEF